MVLEEALPPYHQWHWCWVRLAVQWKAKGPLAFSQWYWWRPTEGMANKPQQAALLEVHWKEFGVHNLRAEKGQIVCLKAVFPFADSPQLAILRSVHQPFSVSNPTWGKESYQSLSTQSLNHRTRNQLLYHRGLEYWKGLEFNKIEYKGVDPLLSQREGNLFKVTSLLSVKKHLFKEPKTGNLN